MFQLFNEVYLQIYYLFWNYAAIFRFLPHFKNKIQNMIQRFDPNEKP